jgi:dTDP-4-dehydrorhamnose reductase
MKLLVTGGNGQLGRSVARRGASAGHVVAALDVDRLDICDQVAVGSYLDEHRPTLVINAAAYTAVDRAETERGRAFAINRDGVGVLARACAHRSVRLLHVSTDYVFDGTATRPYREDDEPTPLGAYGESKFEGERLAIDAGGTVVRTSWLFEERGPSFVHTMLRLAAERSVLRVVADQQGCPTWADDLADALLALSGHSRLASRYHYCGDGPTTWHGFAEAIVEQGRRHRELLCTRIEPISTAEYPTPARRPAYSVLDTTRIRDLGIVPPPWTIGLARVVAHALAEV